MIEQEVVALESADEQPATIAPSVGAQLMQGRLARGLSISDVAQRLKLGERQVEALEAGNWNSLPGATIVRGFVRNYARLLEIDSNGLMSQLDEILVKPAESLAVPEMRPTKPLRTGSGRRNSTVVMAAMLSLLVAAVLYFLMPNDLSSLRDGVKGLLDSVARKETAVPSESSASGAPAQEPVLPPGATPQQVLNPQAVPAAEAPAPVPAKPPAQEQTPVVHPGDAVAQLRFVVDKESWVEVRDRDNKVIFSQRMGTGMEQSVNGQGPLSLVIGYSPGVRLYWRGQAIDLAPHTRADVARLVLE